MTTKIAASASVTGSATMPIIKYTIEDFQRFISNGFNHNTLDENIMKIIQSISSSVGSPEYIKTPQFKTNQQTVCDKNKKSGQHAVSNMEWEALRKFKATVFEKKKGIDSSIDQIRKSLNKMTDKTYDTLITTIISEIDKIISLSSKKIKEDGDFENTDIENGCMELEITDDLMVELNRIGNAIFNIASGNGFYSKMYANLYNELMTKYGFMRVIFDKNVDEMNEIFKNIEYCDPSIDYDKFCDNNKTNEKRRSLSLFYIHLMKLGIITTDKMLGIIKEIQNNMISMLDEIGKQNVIEELSEIVFIMVKNSINNKRSMYEATPLLWSPVIENIRLLSTMKIKTKPSISSKTIFKHLDILDALEAE
jgi:hypothetical protein